MTIRSITSVRDISASDQFFDEEVKSEYGYFSGYQPKGIVDQITRLRELFPELGTVNLAIANSEFPPKSSRDNEYEPAWFAIPRWQKLAPNYDEAIDKVFVLINNQISNGRFFDWQNGYSRDCLRQHTRTSRMLKNLGDQQAESDILIFPAQFGFRHRGRSVRRAREVFVANEFGLGVFAVGVMLLTHPSRLKNYHDLWIDCAGDERDSSCDDNRFSRASFFRFNDDRIEYTNADIGSANSLCGSASGFLL